MRGQRVFTHLWMAWERVFAWMARLHPLRPGERHMFFIARRRYLGHPFVVDGVEVRRFDPVLELHMNNEILMEGLREGGPLFGVIVKLLQEAKRSLPVLAERAMDEEFRDVRVLYGVTFIHRGVERMGFTSFPIRNRLLCRLTTWYLHQLLRIVNPHADELLATHADAFVPKVVAISKARLVQMYGAEGRRAPVPAPDHVSP
ncbi:hypothetical protein GCM10010885_18830 [Alicyclobacillus cellulosilyticus]|uniref:YkoP-like domain-containing protein n=1 Tax=Alicyclobacillus cellulosilyticus TaxID=1003997 RepID=A0A917KE33_9BACL|nr:polysaccharide deacetylase [Alicyclobacillus cellulosilyticus]GGJ09928.1 hypothetical protein GCM10010885_18830 [Alicyclobacillus cellulosilyticus]